MTIWNVFSCTQGQTFLRISKEKGTQFGGSRKFGKSTKNGVRKTHFLQKKWLSLRAKTAILLMEESSSLCIPDPAEESLPGAVKNATFLIFFTPFLRFLKVPGIIDFVQKDVICKSPRCEPIATQCRPGDHADFNEGLAVVRPANRHFFSSSRGPTMSEFFANQMTIFFSKNTPANVRP